MQNQTYHSLEFNKIKETVMTFTLSEQAKDLIHNLEPSTSADVIINWLNETTEAKAILNKSSSVPLNSLTGIDRVIGALGKGMNLNPDQLTQIGYLLETGKKMIRFMKDKETVAPQVSSYVYSISELPDLAQEIDRCIRNGRVDDAASKALAKIRKKVAILEDRIKDKLERIIRSSNHQGFFQDQLVSIRDGRYVIPVKKEYKKNIDGNILDHSSSGATVYVEPAEVKKLQNELNLEKAAEEVEVQKVLSSLTGMVEAYERQISVNIETMVYYDFIFAKAKYSKSIDGRAVAVNSDHYISLKEARHPLLPSAVPLDFTIGKDYKALVITGPNTGGKTVAIKTVGLLALMVQSGLHVPVAEGSTCAIFEDVMVDIGDGQSIEQSLSTFSAHMTNIIHILKGADHRTLVILDELGSGTDPAEGKGLAIAILEKLAAQGVTLLATTHYSEIKEFANEHDYFENGSMEFDVETLQPLYRLNIGKAGESQAFSIAFKLGMDLPILERAHELTYKEKKEYLPRDGQKHTSSGVQNSKSEHSSGSGTNRVEQKSHVKLTPDSWRDGMALRGNHEQGNTNTSTNANTNTNLKPELAENQKLTSKAGKHDKNLVQASGTAQNIDQANTQPFQEALQLGDRVFVSSLKTHGIVCELENHRGEVGVLIQQKKVTVNKKRLTVQGRAQDLYPENYDLNIVLQSKETRKKSRLMQRKHVENVIIDHSEDDKRRN